VPCCLAVAGGPPRWVPALGGVGFGAGVWVQLALRGLLAVERSAIPALSLNQAWQLGRNKEI